MKWKRNAFSCTVTHINGLLIEIVKGQESLKYEPMAKLLRIVEISGQIFHASTHPEENDDGMSSDDLMVPIEDQICASQER